MLNRKKGRPNTFGQITMKKALTFPVSELENIQRYINSKKLGSKENCQFMFVSIGDLEEPK